MNMIDDWFWEELTKKPYPYYYCSCHDESTIEKWAKKKIMDNLKEMNDNMSEKKYVKDKGIVILEETLPEIFNELINKDYVERVTVNKPNECIIISTDDDIIGERYSFGKNIIIGEDKIDHGKDTGEEYTACWLFNNSKWMDKLYADNNVSSFTVTHDPDRLMLTVDGKTYSITHGVIVFDECNHFVECFDDNHIHLDSAMVEHGYKKANYEK